MRKHIWRIDYIDDDGEDHVSRIITKTERIEDALKGFFSAYGYASDFVVVTCIKYAGFADEADDVRYGMNIEKAIKDACSGFSEYKISKIRSLIRPLLEEIADLRDELKKRSDDLEKAYEDNLKVNNRLTARIKELEGREIKIEDVDGEVLNLRSRIKELEGEIGIKRDGKE